MISPRMAPGLSFSDHAAVTESRPSRRACPLSFGIFARANHAQQSKWGRPEGRPHSHRRVVLANEALGAQCRCRWQPIRRSLSVGSVTGARTGIRFLPVVGRDPRIRFRPPVGSETGSSVMVSHRWRRSFGQSRSALPGERPGRTDRWKHRFRVLLERPTCFEPKFSACRSRRPRGQMPPPRYGANSLDLSVPKGCRIRAFRPVSMTQRCLANPSRTSAQDPAFPLSPTFAVDTSG